MSNNLVTIKISDIGQTITGKTPSSQYPEDFGDEFMFITPSDNFDSRTIYKTERYLSQKGIEKLNTKLLPPKSILVSCIGSAMGKVIMNRSKAISNQQINSIIPNSDRYNNDYIYYLLKNNYFLLRNAATGSTALPLLNKTDFDLLELKLDKNLMNQQKIASVLSVLDDKIELNNKINTELEQMAKTLYDYWFVQFDFPNEDGKPYKSSGGKMVYNDVLKREIPDGWEVKRLKGLVDFTRGISYTSKTMNEESGIPMINLKSFNLNGTYRIDGLKYFTGKLNESRIIDKDDLLIAITDVTREAEIIGRAILTPDFGVDAVCSCDVARVDIIDPKLKKNYLRYLFNSKYYHDYIKHFASGTLVLHLDLNGVLWYKDVIPSIDIQEKFEDFVFSIDSKIQANLKQNQELAELRDWLLPMLMNGQVSVGDVVDQEANIVKGDRRIRDLFGDEEYLRRKALAVYIVNQSLGDKSFGKTKFMKLLHLVEYHIVQGSLEQAYYKHAAGPYDGAFATKFWNEVIEDKWYRIEKLGTLDHIIPGENHYGTKDYTSSITDDLKQEIKAFIHIFKDSNYKQPEVVSTLYAVWNNRIIQKEMITDVLLKQDFLAWDEQKEKYVDILDKALVWMRSNKIVPTGWGKVINASKSRRYNGF
ncbi:restriction endonuclease subunit S [Myroides marinus]|uniref:restriction endonuclease subunit S n=1 Tax=Myroides marinus TaxID=703342 RepID=UPI002576439A|nr:restriction endonuclease subunit S [Myroides marinus]